MSSGGLLQLVAYGAQDVYITGQPQITFFRVVYRRHTNFAMESMEQTLTGTADFGRKVSCLVSRNGDLLHRAYLEVSLPALPSPGGTDTVAWTRNVGHVMLDEVSVDIGGAVIDRHYGIYYNIYHELTQTAEKQDGYSVMIGNTEQLTNPTHISAGAGTPAATLYIPLIFWFNRNPGLALPLVALLHHDVKINISFRPASELYTIYNASGVPQNTTLSTTPSLVDVKLFIDYIFCDAPERRMFAQMNHEYLIETLQFVGSSSASNATVREKLSFSHPTKELIWAVQMEKNVTGGRNRWSDFTTSGDAPEDAYIGGDPVVDARIQLGSHDRITTRKYGYFNLVQPYFHHTRMPSSGIYVYSFALRPEEHQPSGSINMSRIESLTLNMTLATGSDAVRIFPFTVAYNVLRVTAGMAGLAYAS